MSLKTNPKVALIGNPNSGKSSLFNQLTGLNQKVGNFPGVTVDKKTGKCKIDEFITADLIDLPGTYSLYPKSKDEQIVFDFLTNPKDKNYPDIIVVIIDTSNLKRNLLLFTQIKDLGFPVILALNMVDVADKKGIKINIENLKNNLQVPVVTLNARKGKGLEKLKRAIANPDLKTNDPFLDTMSFAPEAVCRIKDKLNISNNYLALQLAHQHEHISNISEQDNAAIREIKKETNFDSILIQSKETIARYEKLSEILVDIEVKDDLTQKSITEKIDGILTHKIYGYISFMFILFLIFQVIFAWAAVPMEVIDAGFGSMKSFLQDKLPESLLTDLLTNGIIAGLGGIVIFIPQIALLFGFIAILEESGYMSRVMFMMDKIMRKFGMNGKSVIPLISGVACAVPAIMATRNIDNWKERFITIFVTPFMSCSARLPVFTILIALVVPKTYYLGFLNLQGIVLMGLYLFGFLAAIGTAWVMKLILNSKEKSYFIMEYPNYKMPRFKNVGYTIYEKSKTFVFEAGKIIMAISLILWVLSSYGPGEKMNMAESAIVAEGQQLELPQNDIDNKVAAVRLENSYAGHFGKFIEPGIRPLGFDWKIGIALITSFAAREVFVGTMATIYSIGEDDAEGSGSLIKKLKYEKDAITGKPYFNLAVAGSLLVFYVLAMQCMSTIAVVYRETKGWKWPVMQFFYMTGLAYLASFVVYNILS